MYAEIKLNTAKGDVVTVPMLATASTPIRFKMMYGKDLMSGILTTNINGDGFDMSVVEIVSQLAFLMSMQAAKADITTLDVNKYIAWLDDFDSNAFIDNANEILSVYIKSRNNTSKAKK